MATVTPTISVITNPAVSVTMAGGVTYEEFLNSLGQFVYLIRRYQLSANGYKQVQEPIAYNIYDANGTLIDKSIIPNVDPYQSAASIVKELKQQGVLLNGRSGFAFNLYPNEFIQLILETDEISSSDGLNKFGKSNFRQVDDNIGNLKLFEDFKKTL